MISNLPSRRAANVLVFRRQFQKSQIADMALVVCDQAIRQPLLEPVAKKGIAEILAPQRAIANARFGHRSIEIEHAYQSRPRAAPIRYRENWSTVRR